MGEAARALRPETTLDEGQQLHVLTQLASALTSSSSFADLFDVLADIVREAVPLDRVAIVTFNLKAGTFTDAYVVDTELPGWRRGETHALAGSLYGAIAASGSGAVVSDLALAPDAGHPPISLEFSARFPSLVAAPITWQRRPIGALALRSARVGVYGSRHLAFVERLASLIAPALDNARLSRADDWGPRRGGGLGGGGTLLATITRELQTALTSVVVAVSLLRERARRENAGASEDEVAMLDEGARRMWALVDESLQFAQLQGPGPALRMQPVDLAEQVRGVATRLDRERRDRSQRFDLEVERGASWSRGDPGRLRALLVHLLEYAHRSAPEHGHVGVRISRAGGMVMLEVADDGPGLSPAEQAAAFTPFWGRSRRDGRGGAGAGLALTIAHRLAELHGGSLTVSDPPSGEGVVFRLRLPAERDWAA